MGIENALRNRYTLIRVSNLNNISVSKIGLLLFVVMVGYFSSALLLCVLTRDITQQVVSSI